MSYMDGNYIIRVTAAESEQIQNAVFKAGGSWASGSTQVMPYLDLKYLIIEGLEISRTNCMMDCNYYRIKPFMFIEGLKAECRVEKLSRSFTVPMKGAARFLNHIHDMSDDNDLGDLKELQQMRAERDAHEVRISQDALDAMQYSLNGQSVEITIMDDIERETIFSGAPRAGKTQALKELWTHKSIEDQKLEDLRKLIFKPLRALNDLKQLEFKPFRLLEMDKNKEVKFKTLEKSRWIELA